MTAEREGFEPPYTKGVNGFRDRPVQPLRHLSILILDHGRGGCASSTFWNLDLRINYSQFMSAPDKASNHEFHELTQIDFIELINFLINHLI